MKATTAFTQVKTTDAKGHVTYRVGGVFAAQCNSMQQLSIIMEGCAMGQVIEWHRPAAARS